MPNFILVNVEAKITYAMLQKYAQQDGYCFPGQKRLTKDIGVAQRSVVKFIKALQEAGFINIEKCGQGLSNIYQLNFHPRKK